MAISLHPMELSALRVPTQLEPTTESTSSGIPMNSAPSLLNLTTSTLPKVLPPLLPPLRALPPLPELLHPSLLQSLCLTLLQSLLLSLDQLLLLLPQLPVPVPPLPLSSPTLFQVPPRHLLVSVLSQLLDSLWSELSVLTSYKRFIFPSLPNFLFFLRHLYFSSLSLLFARLSLLKTLEI